MAFDATAYAPNPAAPTLQGSVIDTVGDICPMWAAENPDRALALLFVAPRACAAVDVLVSM